MEAATIEETNRIRVSLGMKPLPVPGADLAKNIRQAATPDNDEEASSTLEGRQSQAYDNYKQAQNAEEAKRRREEKAAAVRKAREKAQRFAVLEGKGLGDGEEGGDVDAKAWLMGQKKRQKQIERARKLEEELAAAEAAAAAAVQYTSKDLAGVKVAHDTTSFLDGDEQILTLKDTTIDQNEKEGDELENLSVREQEKLADRLDLMKKMRGYNPNDYEDGDGSILAQYDEEINGKKTKNFTLDTDGAIAELSDILEQPLRKERKVQLLSLDDVVVDAPLSSDYLAASEVKIKKPKKKKNKNTRQKQHDDDDVFPLESTHLGAGAMDTDSNDTAPSKERKADTEAFVDDEDLQASLAIQRKSALKKRKKTRPEDIAKQLKEEGDEAERNENESQDGGLVIGEISEFVAGLSKPDADENRKSRRQKQATKSYEVDEDHDMADDNDDGHGHGHGYNDDHREASSVAAQEDDAGIDEEKNVGEGMGAALSLLRERGLLADAQGGGKFENFRNREEFLSRKRVLESELDEQTRQQRERDRMSGRLDRMSVREREEWARQQNTWRDHQQSKKVADLFQNSYKPNVELKYVDEHGRKLDQKEAFKHLSHQFHGKGSGKGKTEKRLKKIEDEKRHESQSMFDASQAGMNLATAQQLKKRREAGVRLG